MPDPDNVPAEVQAARRALNRSGGVQPPKPAIGTAITANSPITPSVDGLLNEILASDAADIIGILPWPCARRLIELQGPQLDIPSGAAGLEVRYFTPASDLISLYRQSQTMGMIVQRWSAGITAVRNWLRPGVDRAANKLALFEFDDIYLDCMIRTVTRGVQAVTLISQLPIIRPADEASEEATLVITRMPAGQLSAFDDYLSYLVDQSRPVVLHQILCRPDSGNGSRGKVGNEFRPKILKLQHRSELRAPNTVSAGAVVIARARTPDGTGVLLQRRTARNSLDDLNTLSLISERVLDVDLPAELRGSISMDPGMALEHMWLRAGQPKDFEIPESAFRHAAQRELFMACGLDVPNERLHFSGTCFVEREGENQFLGFFVYRVDMLREASFDELSHVRSWNSDLELHLLDDLYSPSNRPRLNRLLRLRESWLTKSVFNAAFDRVGAAPQ